MSAKYLYIVLTRTCSIVARTISFLTGAEYSHASIALDEELSVMYSFGRRWRYNPFIGGFSRENINSGLFADSKVLPCAVLRLEVTVQQYDKAREIIEDFSRKARTYRYNYLGLFLAAIGREHKSRNRYYCSEFVHDVLTECGAIDGSTTIAARPQDLLRYGSLIWQGDWKRRTCKNGEVSRVTAD